MLSVESGGENSRANSLWAVTLFANEACDRTDREEVVWISRKYSSYIVNVSRSHSI